MSRKIGREKSKVLTVRIPGEWMAKLKEMADDENPVSELLRTAIKRLLKV